MGSVYQAYCGCGYNNEVTVGGSRRRFLEQSSFPFFCAHCGLGPSPPGFPQELLDHPLLDASTPVPMA